MKNVTVPVTDMKCEGCAWTVAAALARVKGVRRADVSLEEKRARVVMEDDTSADELIAAVMVVMCPAPTPFDAPAGSSPPNIHTHHPAAEAFRQKAGAFSRPGRHVEDLAPPAKPQSRASSTVISRPPGWSTPRRTSPPSTSFSWDAPLPSGRFTTPRPRSPDAETPSPERRSVRTECRASGHPAGRSSSATP